MSFRNDGAAALALESGDGPVVAAMREGFAGYLRPTVMSMLQAVRLDVLYQRAAGSRMWGVTASGREIEVSDFLGGFGASLFGHNPADLTELARRHLSGKLPINAQASVRGYAGLLAKTLSDEIGRRTGGRSYVTTLANSGAEAVEAALKHAEMEACLRHRLILEELEDEAARARLAARSGQVTVVHQLADTATHALDLPPVASLDELLARLLSAAAEQLSRPGVVLAFQGSFHGKTTGALRLTHNPDYRAYWQRLGQAEFLPLNDVAALEQAVAVHRRPYLGFRLEAGRVLRVEQRLLTSIVAAFVEPVQGEGGIWTADPAHLKALRRQADTEGFPLVFDEIQSGMGRTGTFLASEVSGVPGDYYLLGKSLGGGIAKLAALVVERGRYRPEFGFLHTSTFADDEWSSAIGLECVNQVTSDSHRVLEACRKKGNYLVERLNALVARFPDQLAEVRGRGLMLGVELRPQLQSRSPLLRAISEQDLLGYFAAGYLLNEHGIRVAPALSARATLRLEPPACISYEELDRFSVAMEEFVGLLQAGDSARLFNFALSDKPAPHSPRPSSTRVRPSDVPRSAQARSIGFLVHFATPADLRHFDSGLNAFSDDVCEQFLDRVRGLFAPFLLQTAHVRSVTGAEVELKVVAVPFTSTQAVQSMRAGDLRWITRLVRDAATLAAELGCEVLGCGGYTSIVTDNCRQLSADRMALTSGNALTVTAGFQALWSAFRARASDRPRVGVVGATGNIGAMLCQLAAERASEVVLVGRPGSSVRLQKVAAQLGCATRVETDLRSLRDCSLIICASNAPAPVLRPEHLGSHPVVLCDLAVPRDVSPEVAELPNVRLIRGGLVRLPLGQRLDIAGLEPAAGSTYACLAETLLLGLDGRRESFSYGALELAQIREIEELAVQHGFTVEAKSA